MRRFILRVLMFMVPIVLLYTFATIYAEFHDPVNHNDYMAEVSYKHDRISKIKVPKIIFAGGSNLAFGINSESIEKEFRVPVVNLGLHAGLGLSFILEELKHSIRGGDVVFVSIEYFLDLEGDYKLKKYTSEYYHNANQYYEKSILKELQLQLNNTRENLINSLFADSQNDLNSANLTKEINVYSRAAFNQYGDVIAHLNRVPQKELMDGGAMNYRHWEGIEALNDFFEFAKKRNVTVFYLYPNYPKSEYNKNKKAIAQLAKDLSDNLKVEILNKPIDFIFDDADFYDTIYHLNKSGREKRTKELIKVIRQNKNVQLSIAQMRRI